MYYRTGPGAAQLAAAKGAAGGSGSSTANSAPANGGISALSSAAAASAAALPSAAVSSTTNPHLQPRFMSLRPPPGLDTANSPSPSAFPRGSTADQRSALSGYASHGYTPHGVSLPPPVVHAGATAITADEPTKQKRGADALSDGMSEGPDAKRFRGEQDNSDHKVALGPSPVKDLNALGRITSPTSALRGARAPARSARVSLGPPDAFKALQLDGTRFADRPYTMQEGNEGERRVRAKLLDLFAADRLAVADTEEQSEYVTPNDERKLDEVLIDLRQAGASASPELRPEGSQSTTGRVNGRADVDDSPPWVDLVIDDHGHSALHWAAALAKLSYVRMLVAKAPSSGGANTHAGNHGGETALHRAVLVSNAYDTSAFPVLLRLLAPSLHTRDYRKRTVLHHIALVSHIRGRSVAARYYLACVLEYIGKHQGGRFAGLVDAQDDDGETALSIVARNGNANMVKMLLDVGARKDIVNSLGLKASDWGIDGLEAGGADESGVVLDTTPSKERSSEAVSSLTRPPRAPVQKSKDVLEQMSTVLSDLADVFQKELGDKTEAFNVAQTHLQSATRELALRRRRIAEGQTHVAERDEARMRWQNLVTVLKSEMGVSPEYDGTELVDKCLADASESNKMELDGPASADSKPFAMLHVKDEAPFRLSEGSSNGDEKDEDALVRMRWLAHWYETRVHSLETRISELDTAAQAKMEQCRKVVAMCCGVPEARVEDMLDELVTAIESIGVEGVDLQRLAGFLSKVKEPARA